MPPPRISLSALSGRLAHPILLHPALTLICILVLLSIYIIHVQAWVDNRPPVGVNDSYTAHGIFSVSVPGVLGNDSDPDGDTLTVSYPPSLNSYCTGHGCAVFNANGSLTYYPNPGYVGPDSVTYTVSDPRGGSANATVSFNVVNNPPSAGNDTFTIHGWTPIAAPGILGNDSDPDGDPISLFSPTPYNLYITNQGGSAYFNSDGSFWYRPNGGFVGTDSWLRRRAALGDVCRRIGLPVRLRVIARTCADLGDGHAR